MKKFAGKYRIESTRLRHWDYSWKGKYFITICTKNRQLHFGDIIEGKMHLSEIGIEVEQQWLNTVNIRPDMNLELYDFQVMPNHFHGIIGIGRNEYNNVFQRNNPLSRVNQFGPQTKNLASIIRGFKGAVTSFARRNNIQFDWQPLFHDHLIRNDQEFFRIKRYIQNNVKNWEKDRFKEI